MREHGADTFIRRILIGADHRVRLDLDVPADFPQGEAEATVMITPLFSLESPENRLRNIRGKGEGRFWMSDDFDAPLEEFAEYL